MANFLGTAFHSLWGYLASDRSSPPPDTPAPIPEQKDPSPLNPSDNPHPPPPSSAEPPLETTEQPSEPTMPSNSDIPWREIHTTHISQLRGHLKYLILLSTHPSAKNQLAQQITTTKTLIASATAAAKLAGIIIDDATRTTKRKSRLSVTFAELDEVLEKKVKMRHSKGNKGLRKPSAEAMAGLKSRLGKRGREEEEGEEEGVKRSRVAYLQKGDPAGEYEDDGYEGEEEEKEVEEPAPATSVPKAEKSSDTPTKTKSSDAPEAKDATPATGKRTKTTTPAHETPKSAKKVKTTNTPTPAPIRTRSQSTPSTQTRPIDDEATPKPAKKQKQNPKSPKHPTEGSTGGEAKKQKKDR